MDTEQRELIEQLFLEMYDKLLMYARYALPESSLAEEAVQETFQIACQKPESLQESPNPKGWLVNTLKNTIRNIKHNRANAERILAQYLHVPDDRTYSEDELNLTTLYEDIADTEEFKILKEFAIDGRSHLEMATARGITINACKKRLQRAKEKLRIKILE
jgi:RNA polymerase sigma-70 factor (ECF subfamily)